MFLLSQPYLHNTKYCVTCDSYKRMLIKKISFLPHYFETEPDVKRLGI